MHQHTLKIKKWKKSRQQKVILNRSDLKKNAQKN